jgi:hypothetical protein
MIVNAGKTELSKLLAGVAADGFLYIAVGTGSSAAASGDTTLGTEKYRVLATIERSSTIAPLDTVRLWGIVTATANATLSEFGVFNDDTSGDMLARKLISPTKGITTGQKCLMVWDLVVKDGGFSGSTGC